MKTQKQELSEQELLIRKHRRSIDEKNDSA